MQTESALSMRGISALSTGSWLCPDWLQAWRDLSPAVLNLSKHTLQSASHHWSHSHWIRSHDCNAQWQWTTIGHHTQWPQWPKNTHLFWCKLISWECHCLVIYCSIMAVRMASYLLCVNLSKHCRFLSQSVPSKLSSYTLVFPYMVFNVYYKYAILQYWLCHRTSNDEGLF